MKGKNYWNEYPAQFDETEFFKQVEYTVAGIPISSEYLNKMISDLKNALEINRDDNILDMCCGNGIITSQISKICNSVIGVDFSKYLIYIAKKYHKPDNVNYYCMSILDRKIRKLIHKPFTKIYMYSSLQYFTRPDLKRILEQIRDLSSSNAVIFIGEIPDKDRIWNFFNTDERRKNYLKNKKHNAIGTWWKKEDIENICINNGFEIQFLPLNELTETALYRFNIRLTKQGN
jgi:2-polyprenyl-3-methyl-5-hydroxy-6-metoxy-1,4-benzoquinol methylase